MHHLTHNTSPLFHPSIYIHHKCLSFCLSKSTAFSSSIVFRSKVIKIDIWISGPRRYFSISFNTTTSRTLRSISCLILSSLCLRKGSTNQEASFQLNFLTDVFSVSFFTFGTFLSTISSIDYIMGTLSLWSRRRSQGSSE